MTTEELATTYNNFYEFGLDKTDPYRNAGRLRVKPWSVEISGEIGKKGVYTLEDLLKPHTPLRSGSIDFVASKAGRAWCRG